MHASTEIHIKKTAEFITPLVALAMHSPGCRRKNGLLQGRTPATSLELI